MRGRWTAQHGPTVPFDALDFAQALDTIYWFRVEHMDTGQRVWFDGVLARTQDDWDAIAAERVAEEADRAAAQDALRRKYAVQSE